MEALGGLLGGSAGRHGSRFLTPEIQATAGRNLQRLQDEMGADAARSYALQLLMNHFGGLAQQGASFQYGPWRIPAQDLYNYVAQQYERRQPPKQPQAPQAP